MKAFFNNDWVRFAIAVFFFVAALDNVLGFDDSLPSFYYWVDLFVTGWFFCLSVRLSARKTGY